MFDVSAPSARPPDRASGAPRPAPDWLIQSDFTEHRLGTLKSGKEAEVFLVERRSADASCLLAHKRYRPRAPNPGELRDLGFSNATIYRNSSVYRAGWHLGSRERRAVEGATAFGHKLAAANWPVMELETLRRAWAAGVSVPYPVEHLDDGVLMEFLGDERGAAPRLVDARLDRPALAEAWRQLEENLTLLCRAPIVHADLSVYNLLWWQDRLGHRPAPGRGRPDEPAGARAPAPRHHQRGHLVRSAGRLGGC